MWHIFSDTRQCLGFLEFEDAADISSRERQITHCYHDTMDFIHPPVGGPTANQVGRHPDHN